MEAIWLPTAERISLVYRISFFLPGQSFSSNQLVQHVYVPAQGRLHGLPWYYYTAPLILILFVYLIWRFRRNRLLVFGSFLFLITILPNLPILSARQVIVADRYAYLPLLGILVFIAGLFQVFKQTVSLSPKLVPRIILVAISLVIISFSFLSFERTKIWKNEITLMTDIIKHNHESQFLSKFYRKRADFYVKTGELDKAIADYSSALRINPHDIQSYAYQAYAYIRRDKMNNALYDLDQAISLDPHNALFYSTRALARLHLFDFEGALSDCQACMELDPNIPDVYNIVAVIDYQQKNMESCIRNLNRAIELKPDYAEAYKNRGKVLISLGMEEEASKDLKKAIMLGDQESIKLLDSLSN